MQNAGGVTEPSGDGATHAYLSKGHDRPVRGWHGLLLMRGGWSGIPPPGDAGGTGKDARGVTAIRPVAGANPCFYLSYQLALAGLHHKVSQKKKHPIIWNGCEILS